MNRCVILGGAEIRNQALVKNLMKPNDYIVACDCGYRHCIALGVTPNLICGDFDSHPNPMVDTETIVLPREKDDTDSVYAVKTALMRGYRDFLLLGMVGGRLDHTLGNLSVLEYLESVGAHGLIVDDYGTIELVSDRRTVEPGCLYFSLLAVGGDASGVYIRNAKYPLKDAVIRGTYQYGVSNELLVGQECSVSVKQGKLLLIRILTERIS